MLINLESKIEFSEKVNPLISKYKVYIASADTIANKWYFSKKVLDDMKIYIMGSPVLAAFVDNEDGSYIGAHEDDLIKNKKGNYLRSPKPQAVGFARSDLEPYWGIYNDKEWLITEVYLWDYKYKGLKNIANRKIFQSMEVELDATKEGNIKNVTSAILTALCILENVSPAFAGSTFEKFSKEDFNDEIEKLKQEYEKTKLKPSEKFKINNINKDGEQMSNKSNSEQFLNKEKWGQGEALKVDKSKDNLSDSSWGDVDKTNLRNKILSASNYKSLVKDVYLLVEERWEDSPSSHLKYPAMQLIGDKLVYNKGGLSSALGYAEKNNESGVVSKIKSIYKKMGLETDSFSEKDGEKKKMKDYKVSYKAMKAEKYAYALDNSEDSDDVVALIDGEAGCIYILANGEVSKIPFEVGEDDETFAVKEDKKETMSDSKEMMSKMCNMTKMAKEKAKEEKEKSDAKDVEFTKKQKEKETEFAKKESEKDAEIGKAFAKISSLETAMADSEKAIAEKEEKIKELETKLSAKDVEDKKNKADEMFTRKEFSVFSKEEKEELSKDLETMSLEDFETKLYSVFGKKVRNNIDFSTNTQKFSFMHVEHTAPKGNGNEQKDIYAEIREKENLNKLKI